MKIMNYRNTWIFPSCAVALAMNKPLEEGEILLQYGTIDTSDVESKNYFFG